MRRQQKAAACEESEDDRDFIPETQVAKPSHDVIKKASSRRKRKLVSSAVNGASKKVLHSTTQLEESLDGYEESDIESGSNTTSNRSQSPLLFTNATSAPEGNSNIPDPQNLLTMPTDFQNAAKKIGNSFTQQNDDYMHFNPPITSTAIPKEICGQQDVVGIDNEQINHGHSQMSTPSTMVPLRTSANTMTQGLDPLTKHLMLDDFNDLFVFKTWRLSSAHQTLSKMKIEFPADDEPVMEPILWFLQGDRMITTNEAFLAFLRNSPDRITGNFVVGLMIADFATHVSLPELVQLYNSKAQVSEEYHQVLQTITILRLLRTFRMDESNEVTLDIIPESLQDFIALDFISDLTNNNESLSGTTSSYTEQEKDCIFAVISALTRLMFRSLEAIDCYMLDETFSYKDRSQAWTTLIPEYINGILKHVNLTPLEIILLSDQKLRQGTRHFVNVKVGEAVTPLHLHQNILQKYCSSPFQSETVVDALECEISTFINLLYRKFSVDIFKGEITIGVFRLARQLQITDIWEFLFRGNDLDLFISDENKKDLLQIAIILRRDLALEKLTSGFMELFCDRERSKCINGLDQEDVGYFFQHKLEIDELEIYKMLIQWSFNQCNKPCNDELSAKFYQDVYSQFLLVRKNLILGKLRKHFGQLARQKYITLQDIRRTNTLALTQGGLESSASDPQWFAIGSRENNKIN
ncbi:unnamed protein product [Orchesella dallaii]|uniref:BACK domain-containing protein n=1 Tax=Orchesella dallaii TaxID=48710 RepID=A0ABP1PUQ7_9HEXA